MRAIPQDQTEKLKCTKRPGIKLMDLIRGIVSGMEAHIEVTWDTTKYVKFLYTFFHLRNMENNNHMK